MNKLVHYCCLFISALTFAQNQHQGKIEAAVEAYAFLSGHFHTLKEIKTRFPQLAMQADDAERLSHRAFGPAKENIEDFLIDTHGEKAFARLKMKTDSVLVSQFKDTIEEIYARDMIAEVHKRLQGSLPSGLHKTILAYTFSDAPEEELRMHPIRHSLDIEDNLKVSINIPASWKPSYSAHPQTIRQFTSFYGKGNENIIIMVFDMPGVQPHAFTEQAIRGIIPPGSGIAGIRPWQSDNFKGYVAEIEEHFPIKGESMKIRMYQFMMVHEEKLYCIQGSVGPVPSGENLVPALQKYKPLFYAVAQTLNIE